MTAKEALEIVYDLAEQNCLDIGDCDENLVGCAKSQDEALAIIADIIKKVDWQFFEGIQWT